jgi:hypothetical protein
MKQHEPGTVRAALPHLEQGAGFEDSRPSIWPRRIIVSKLSFAPPDGIRHLDRVRWAL